MTTAGLRSDQLDGLLRTKRFVDLYAVVREAIRASESSYSLKNLETFYMAARQGGVPIPHLPAGRRRAAPARLTLPPQGSGSPAAGPARPPERCRLVASRL